MAENRTKGWHERQLERESRIRTFIVVIGLIIIVFLVFLLRQQVSDSDPFAADGN